MEQATDTQRGFVQAPEPIPIYLARVDDRPLRIIVPTVFAKPTETLNWFAADAAITEWAVHFPAPSPLVRNGKRVRRVRFGDDPVQVRLDNPAGKYNYFIAVVVDGKIYTEDPPLIDDGDET